MTLCRIAALSLFHFERGQCPRNQVLGGGSEGGRSALRGAILGEASEGAKPPPSGLARRGSRRCLATRRLVVVEPAPVVVEQHPHALRRQRSNHAAGR